MKSPRNVFPLAALVLSLLLAVSSTSYAAGLARNSVGTAQLKSGAVTGGKIRPNAVTGGLIRAASVTSSDLAPAARAQRAVVISRDLSQGVVTLGSISGVKYSATCSTDSPIDSTQIALSAVNATTTNVELTGTFTEGNGTTSSALVTANGFSFQADPPSVGSTATTTFDGTLRAVGGPTSQVRITIGTSDGVALACKYRLVVTPLT